MGGWVGGRAYQVSSVVEGAGCPQRGREDGGDDEETEEGGFPVCLFVWLGEWVGGLMSRWMGGGGRGGRTRCCGQRVGGWVGGLEWVAGLTLLNDGRGEI